MAWTTLMHGRPAQCLVQHSPFQAMLGPWACCMVTCVCACCCRKRCAAAPVHGPEARVDVLGLLCGGMRLRPLLLDVLCCLKL